MKKFFKMKNLVKKNILILQKFFWKIVEKLKKNLFGNIQNRSKLPNLAKKIPIVVLIYILKKKEKFSAWIWGNLHFLEGRFEKKN